MPCRDHIHFAFYLNFLYFITWEWESRHPAFIYKSLNGNFVNRLTFSLVSSILNWRFHEKIGDRWKLQSISIPSWWSWNLKFEHSTEERHRCSIFAVPSFKSIGQLITGVVFAKNPAQSRHRCWPCYKQQRRYNRARYGLPWPVL